MDPKWKVLGSSMSSWTRLARRNSPLHWSVFRWPFPDQVQFLHYGSDLNPETTNPNQSQQTALLGMLCIRSKQAIDQGIVPPTSSCTTNLGTRVGDVKLSRQFLDDVWVGERSQRVLQGHVLHLLHDVKVKAIRLQGLGVQRLGTDQTVSIEWEVV